MKMPVFIACEAHSAFWCFAIRPFGPPTTATVAASEWAFPLPASPNSHDLALGLEATPVPLVLSSDPYGSIVPSVLASSQATLLSDAPTP